MNKWSVLRIKVMELMPRCRRFNLRGDNNHVCGAPTSGRIFAFP
ncbi:hypothetical protein J2S49_001315 [Arcanobacterium wilhelmae]|uniref:Uncharacterized protein n=1 Tax=Arcanobacterium wilhelmae TaxID=1803177 RepID=A0ABT9NBZ2_9ACTO|nr:hypothetical protein [Arcanobacterium wilhelmae]